MKTYEEELEGSPDTVLREADALYGGQGRLQRTYERLSARLTELGAAYCLIGGFAVFLHGFRRFTEDIDILTRPGDLTVLREQLIGKGYVGVPGAERSIRDAETGVRIDFVVTGGFPGDGKPKPVAFPDPGSETVALREARVLGLRSLIELKLASGMTGKGRLQDLADVQRLAQKHGLAGDYAAKLHPYVRDKFIELCEGEA